MNHEEVKLSRSRLTQVGFLPYPKGSTTICATDLYLFLSMLSERGLAPDLTEIPVCLSPLGTSGAAPCVAGNGLIVLTYCGKHYCLNGVQSLPTSRPPTLLPVFTRIRTIPPKKRKAIQPLSARYKLTAHGRANANGWSSCPLLSHSRAGTTLIPLVCKRWGSQAQ